MDWESWPTGRPGPFVSKGRMQEVRLLFQYYNGMRNKEPQTEERNVIHIAEFFASGQGESELYISLFT